MAIVLYTGVNNNTSIPGLVNMNYSDDIGTSNYVGLSNQGSSNFSSFF